MLCAFCDGLSISLLMDLVDIDEVGWPHRFPQKAFYQHHASIEDLVESADGGCEICQTIVACAKFEPDWKHGTHFAWVEASSKSGDSTDVKICLSTSFRSDDDDAAITFDLLHVQFGRQKPPDYYHDAMADDPSEFRADPVPMEITVPIDNPGPVLLGKNQSRVGRWELDFDLASDFNFDVARAWITDCVENHEGCPGLRTYELPTRLIYTGLEPDWSCLRLVQPSKGAKGQYGVLTHCWGPDKIATRLLKSNLASFLEHIPFSDLSKNFQDTLIIANEISCPYIWIDCLCIIQDDNEDWQTESAKMTEIYSHATLTISASASPGSAAGIFNQYSSSPDTKGDGRHPSAEHRENSTTMRVFPKSSPDNTVVKIGPNVDPKMHIKPYQYMDPDVYEVVRETMDSLESSGPLSSRAWTLQEKILSPRRLIYGQKQIYWQCVSFWASADALPGAIPDASEDHVILLMALHDPTYDWESMASDRMRRNLKRDYYGLVWDYQSRDLTFGEDKLPAFSGIARTFLRFFGGEYLAGIWSTDIHNGLMWIGSSSDAWEKFYRAPTWSWASRDGTVDFLTGGLRASIYREKCLCPESPDLELLKHEICPREPSNPYGQIKDAKLFVRGHTKRLIRSRRHLWQTRTEDKTSVGSTYSMRWDDDVRLPEEEIFRTTLDGEDVFLVLGDDDPSSFCLPRTPEMEFLVVFVATITNHVCKAGPSTARPPTRCEPDAEAYDGTETESAEDDAEVCSQKGHDEESQETCEKKEKEEAKEEPRPISFLEAAMSDVSLWMWTEDSAQPYAEWEREDWYLFNADWDPELGNWDYFDLVLLVLVPDSDGGDPCAYRREGIIELSKMTWEYVRSWKVENLTLV
ncbi:hypothetical protein RB601_009794 [Gaeumannomyces tritici]